MRVYHVPKGLFEALRGTCIELTPEGSGIITFCFKGVEGNRPCTVHCVLLDSTLSVIVYGALRVTPVIDVEKLYHDKNVRARLEEWLMLAFWADSFGAIEDEFKRVLRALKEFLEAKHIIEKRGKP